ncbi:MAG: hypothetical protein WCK67_07445 [bacterium]
MNSFNFNTNFKAYKSCESSLDYALDVFCTSKTGSVFDCVAPLKHSTANSATSRKLKNMFRAIDQKITLFDVATSQNSCSSDVTNKATDLLMELRETNDPYRKQEVMDKVDNFFENVKKGNL